MRSLTRSCFLTTILVIVICLLARAFPFANITNAQQLKNDSFTLTVTVNDNKHRLLGDLEQSKFTVVVDNQPAEIMSFSNSGPTSVGILLDTSSSVLSGSKWEIKKRRQSVIEGLVNLVASGDPNNEYFVMAFNSSIELLVDWTSDYPPIVSALRTVTRRDQSLLNDAIVSGLNKVAEGHHKKRALIIVSDGSDNGSKNTYSFVRNSLKRSDVVLYAVGLTAEQDRGSSLGMEGQGVLDELSTISGTNALFSNADNRRESVAEILSFVGLQMKHQYTFRLRAENANAGPKWHKVTITVQDLREASGSKVHLTAKTRPGFYAN